MKKSRIWYIIVSLMMLILFILYRKGLADNLLFYRNDGEMLWLKSITAQFIHFSLIHYLCNILFSAILLRDLKEVYSFKQILFAEILSMLFVSVALLLFAQEGISYAGFSGIVLGWYALLAMKNILQEKNNSRKVQLIIEGIIFIIISVITPGASILMHLAGILSGVLCYLVLANSKVNKF